MRTPDVPPKNACLLVAAGAIVLFALVHLVAMFIGPEAFDYLDAPDLAERMRHGAFLLPIGLTSAIIVGLLVFAAYTLAGAGVIRPLPRLRGVLLTTEVSFTRRGLGVIWFSYLLIVDSPDAIPREVGFSLVSLSLGILILMGRLSSMERAPTS